MRAHSLVVHSTPNISLCAPQQSADAARRIIEHSRTPDGCRGVRGHPASVDLRGKDLADGGGRQPGDADRFAGGAAEHHELATGGGLLRPEGPDQHHAGTAESEDPRDDRGAPFGCALIEIGVNSRRREDALQNVGSE